MGMTDFPDIRNGQQFYLNEQVELSILELIYQEFSTGRALYRVHNRNDGLYYALKIFDLSLNESQSIKSEMLALNRQLQRPELFPRYRSYTEKNGWGYLRLDWMDGDTLTKVYKDSVVSGKSDIIKRVDILLLICKAMEVVHSAKLLHRDLKPDNVLLRDKNDISKGVVIIDFGLSICKRRPEEGTRGYQAPEQEYKRNFNLNQCTDIYGIGQIGWWLLTGKPFLEYPDESYTDWADVKPGHLRSLVPIAPEQLEQALLKALAFNPKNRYREVKHLSYELNGILRALRR